MGFDFLDFGFPRSGTDWKSINGKPEITVSSKGRSNGLSNKINNGADFGVDTTLGATSPSQTGPPYTQTLGMYESMNYLQSLGGGTLYFKRSGTINLSTMQYFSATNTASMAQGTYNNIDIIFEKGTTFNLSQLVNSTLTPAVWNFFTFLQGSSNITIHGNGTIIDYGSVSLPSGADGIYVFDFTQPLPNLSQFSNIEIEGFQIQNIAITKGGGAGGSILLGNGYNIKFHDNILLNIVGDVADIGGSFVYVYNNILKGWGANPALTVGTTYSSINVTDIWVYDNYFQTVYGNYTGGGNDEGISIITQQAFSSNPLEVDRVYIFHNTFRGSNKYSGDIDNNQWLGTLKGLLIADNIFDYSDGYTSPWAISLDVTNVYDAYILNNVIRTGGYSPTTSYIDLSSFYGTGTPASGTVNATIDGLYIYDTSTLPVTTAVLSLNGHVSETYSPSTTSIIRLKNIYGVNTKYLILNYGATETPISIVEKIYGTISTGVVDVTATPITYMKDIPSNIISTTTPAVPASATAQQNTNPYAVNVYLYGGTVTAIQITKNGTAYTVFSNTTGLALSGQGYELSPSDSIIITYTTVPTWVWMRD